MIVWGGEGDNFQFLNTGGKYDPSTNKLGGYNYE